jgi:hypothetical protein
VLRFAEGLAGGLIVVGILVDVFQAVIVPRAVGRRFRISPYFSVPVWRLWRRIAIGIADQDRREDFLATYAPAILVGTLILWVGGLVFGYGLILYAARDGLRPHPHFGTAVYFAGTSLLTIGYGDIIPTTALTRAVSLAAAASGLGVLAITTAFLFQLFSAFQTREIFVVTFSTRAGQPPSGVTLLENYARLGIVADLADVFEEGQRWSAHVLENHMAYPSLSYFRSSHDDESWVGALGALLDASTLVLTTVADVGVGHAKLMNGMGRHVTHDLGNYYGLEGGRGPGVERREFDVAYARLADAGYAMREAEDAWQQFSGLRSTYAMSLNAMAQYWRIPPVQWIGDRSILPPRHIVPAAASPEPVEAATETAAR